MPARLLLTVALGVLAALSCGCGAEDVPDEPALPEVDLGRYEEARRFLADPGARAWSRDIRPDELVDLVNDCYHAGAEEVVFADIGEFNGKRVSSWLAVRLPQDPELRAPVFRAFEDFLRLHYPGYTVRDAGQRYLDVALD